MPQRFFIAGCQRSGTTMLRLVLDSHPDIRCLDEALAYDDLAGRSEVPSTASSARHRAIGFKIPRFSEQLTWPEMVDPDYGRLPTFYDGEKTLFIVRDACDVIASMMSLKADESRSWLERYALQILQCTLPSHSGNAQFTQKLAMLEHGELPMHLVGALYWELKNQGLPALRRAGYPVLPLRYETLVKQPRPHLEAVMRFLDLRWSEALLMHHQLAHDGLDASGMAIGNTNPKRAIDSASIGHAALLLSDLQRHEIRSFVAGTCDQLAKAGLAHDL